MATKQELEKEVARLETYIEKIRVEQTTQGQAYESSVREKTEQADHYLEEWSRLQTIVPKLEEQIKLRDDLIREIENAVTNSELPPDGKVMMVAAALIKSHSR